jgi:hypothetical protein
MELMPKGVVRRNGEELTLPIEVQLEETVIRPGEKIH